MLSCLVSAVCCLVSAVFCLLSVSCLVSVVSCLVSVVSCLVCDALLCGSTPSNKMARVSPCPLGPKKGVEVRICSDLLRPRLALTGGDKISMGFVFFQRLSNSFQTAFPAVLLGAKK